MMVSGSRPGRPVWISSRFTSTPKPPAAASEWLGFDAYQTWIVERSAKTGKPVIATYIVDDLKPMEGSVAL